MPYTNLLLYFLSGTGNTYRTARWMAEAAEAVSAPAGGLQTSLIPIQAAEPSAELLTGDPAVAQMIGLLTPTHAFTAPWVMIRFALRLPRGQGQSAFTVLTRAGSMVGNKVFPGLEGSGAYLLALILALKGYRVVGVRGLDLPTSWTALVPGVNPETASRIMAHTKPQAEAFIQALLAGQRRLNSIIPLLFGILLLPLSFLYLMIGRFFLAQLFYANTNCDGCGLCARSCPVKAIRMQGPRSRRFPYWTIVCESCTRCMNYCPKQAVEASYPLAALVIYLVNIPLVGALIGSAAHWIFRITGIQGDWVSMLLSWPVYIAAIFVAYFIFTLILRIPFTNRFLTALTPTHYYRRYTAPGAKLKDLTR